MPSTPKILALDFDGVICDGVIEYFKVSWRTYCQIWLAAEETPPEGLAEVFYRLRPVIETGWEMPILIKALVKGIAEEKILNDWEAIAKAILEQDDLKSTKISTALDKNRDDWIAQDLNGWLSLHRFYPGVVEKIKATTRDTSLYIISTKEARFIQQLLEQQGISLSRDKIFGKEVKRPKYEILRQLIHATGTSPASIWFVEDRLKTLEIVKQQPDLEDVKLFLAEWGYNTSSEKASARNDSRIKLLSLSNFSQDFSDWL
ncbi:HAD family hydrolase [Aetokthonos hydrillicola Thurmond2011]|jgi:FMN phosphatase YigB (HAD superfamily)|uniref:HAD family hydrolase n=1 Tax=Aetokthonos hydrillicola Thurmond2011 TaxID=2712845 RepID=A0AAP5M846_9CYAN|nr:HAD family hydrolase [Aetokthonos hydrillicola]MBO3459912.1 HAD family hydrolase [Aetokthonos hydrillicola CCALA 1050]MBW4584029.1 HAD family hydrolase [Aetokthonos hydrillicola CCALA 1050]MDR9898776.1 HAD family hydrolase [Aetokthonos hydrillicola Thurmond2011]